MGVVKEAYSSGKPSFGVGAGNVQVIVDEDVDFTDVKGFFLLLTLFRTPDESLCDIGLEEE